jgi:hypothetical protein
MEAILAIALGLATSYWILLFIIVAAFYFEYNSSHITSAVLTILGLVSLYTIITFPAMYLLAYVPLGIVWSMWRWKVHCKDCVTKAKNGDLSNHSSVLWVEAKNLDTRKHLAAHVDISKNLDMIIPWIICFPISIVERAAHDLIEVLKIAITEWFAKVYTSFSAKAMKDYDDSL